MTSPEVLNPSLNQMTLGIYQALRQKAQRLLQRNAAHTLEVTALVHEAFVELAGKPNLCTKDRQHFLAICVSTMREILVDHARKRCAAKRGYGQTAHTLDPEAPAWIDQPENLLALEEALKVLSSFNPRLTQIVECRFFAGLSETETAECMGISLRSVQRDWQRARAWLRRELSQGKG
ncbi:MAG: sigma-70 family RNA polymerase sigma factor [Acidobacteria bacterium]|nr:sigma-70 family RNA polymerase sigma factor [Acidobacteriota bacterium]MCB9397678.1 sigma-70 family RNA polymerase sigma factor [Acidobacteriota bacterium]